MIRNAWYVAGLSDQFPANPTKPQKRVLTGTPLVMWRNHDGDIVAFDGRCSHKRFPLWEGTLLESGNLQCAYHGWCYGADGVCAEVPSQTDVRRSTAMNLIPYPVVEQDGLVWVWPGDASASHSTAAPRAPELGENPECEYVVSDKIALRANWRLLIENLLDITHFFPLHDGNIGDRENSEIPVDLIDRVNAGNREVGTSRTVQNYRLPPYYQRWFGYEVVDREHTHVMLGPGLVRVELRVAPPGELGTPSEKGYVLYHTTTCVDAANLEWYWIMATKAGLTSPAVPDERLVDLIAKEFPEVVAQDEWALVKQQEMFELSIGAEYRETNVRSDIAVVRARRVLAALERDEGENTENYFKAPTVLKEDIYRALKSGESAQQGIGANSREEAVR